MEAESLRRELASRGLEVLGVGQHQANPEVLVIYLHGNAGQWVGGYARQVIESVPGVIAVAESVSARTILLARLDLPSMLGTEAPQDT